MQRWENDRQRSFKTGRSFWIKTWNGFMRNYIIFSLIYDYFWHFWCFSHLCIFQKNFRSNNLSYCLHFWFSTCLTYIWTIITWLVHRKIYQNLLNCAEIIFCWCSFPLQNIDAGSTEVRSHLSVSNFTDGMMSTNCASIVLKRNRTIVWLEKNC